MAGAVPVEHTSGTLFYNDANQSGPRRSVSINIYNIPN
jgi:hypothetical protein